LNYPKVNKNLNKGKKKLQIKANFIFYQHFNNKFLDYCEPNIPNCKNFANTFNYLILKLNFYKVVVNIAQKTLDNF
jgi:hypothetical protein